MSRREFSEKVRKQAWARAGMRCEAIGAEYGLQPGQRCNGGLTAGHDFDHVIPDSIGGEPTFENCAVVCKVCHRRKTAMVDTPRAAKTKRQERLHHGPKKRRSTLTDPTRKRLMDGRVVDRRTGQEIAR